MTLLLLYKNIILSENRTKEKSTSTSSSAKNKIKMLPTVSLQLFHYLPSERKIFYEKKAIFLRV
jgi:hypothetical protein